MIVIHIGLPKTGTTTIQRFLRDNAEALRELSIDYPMIGRENVEQQLKHSHIASEVKGGPRAHKKGCENVPALVDHIRGSACRTSVLSAEGFFKSPETGIKEFQRNLSKVDREFRIVLVIRDLVDAVPSGYAQACKRGILTGDFDTFFTHRVLDNVNKDLFVVAQRWASVFGWPAISVRLLTPAALIGGDLIADFLALCGLDQEASRRAGLPQPPPTNESPGWKAVEAMRALHGGRSGLPADHAFVKTPLPLRMGETRDFAAVGQAVARDFGWNKERGFYLTRAQALFCREKFDGWVAQLNDCLSEKLPAPIGLEERGFVERPFLPDVSQIEPRELRAFYDQWSIRLQSGLTAGAADD